MSEQQSIRDGMRRDVSRAVMLGAGLAKPAWTTVPVDDCEPTGEMKSVVSTDVTPFVIFLTDVILASPVIRRIQADTLRDARRKLNEHLLNAHGAGYSDYGLQFLHQEADRIERGD